MPCRCNSAHAKSSPRIPICFFDSVAGIAHLRTEACVRRLESCRVAEICGNRRLERCGKPIDERPSITAPSSSAIPALLFASRPKATLVCPTYQLLASGLFLGGASQLGGSRAPALVELRCGFGSSSVIRDASA